MQTPPPPPFLTHKDAYFATGFNKPHIQTIVSETNDECLLQFMLYAQARRRRQWSIRAVNSCDATETGRFHITHLQVEFDFHRDNHINDVYSMLNIEYVIPANEQGAAPFGFYWLNLSNASALCPTMAEALHAIDAAAPYIPISIRQRKELVERMQFKIHVCKSLKVLAANTSSESPYDSVHAAALRRKLARHKGSCEVGNNN